MTDQPTNKAVAILKEKALSASPLNSLVEMVEKSTAELAKALPSHIRPERMGRIAVTVLKTNPQLAECNPRSFLAALFQCASVGLEPIMGQAFLIPYWNSKTQEKIVQFQIGYAGLVELFYRYHATLSVHAEKVHQDDYDSGNFRSDLGTGEIHHTPNIFKTDRGSVIGYYAVAKLKSGGQQICVMSREEIVSHAKRYSQCYDRKSGKFKDFTPWADELSFNEMAKKTVLKRLLKNLPKSVEIQGTPLEKALQMDETSKTEIAIDQKTGQLDMLQVQDQTDWESQEQDSPSTVVPKQESKIEEVKPPEGLTKDNLFPPSKNG